MEPLIFQEPYLVRHKDESLLAVTLYPHLPQHLSNIVPLVDLNGSHHARPTDRTLTQQVTPPGTRPQVCPRNASSVNFTSAFIRPIFRTRTSDRNLAGAPIGWNIGPAPRRRNSLRGSHPHVSTLLLCESALIQTLRTLQVNTWLLAKKNAGGGYIEIGMTCIYVVSFKEGMTISGMRNCTGNLQVSLPCSEQSKT